MSDRWCIWAAGRELHQQHKSLTHGVTDSERNVAFMREQSPVSLTPAITSSLFTLLKNAGDKAGWAHDLLRMRSGWLSATVMENISALWNKMSYELQRTAYGFHSSVLECRGPELSACIMLSCYRSGKADTLIFMQPVAPVRGAFEVTSGFCASNVTMKSKNSVCGILRIFLCRPAEKKVVSLRPQINNSCLEAYEYRSAN